MKFPLCAGLAVPASAPGRGSFLLAEQNANAALRYADYAYVVENGRTAHHGTVEDLLASNGVERFYPGYDVERSVSVPESRPTASFS